MIETAVADRHGGADRNIEDVVSTRHDAHGVRIDEIKLGHFDRPEPRHREGEFQERVTGTRRAGVVRDFPVVVIPEVRSAGVVEDDPRVK
jgi:hypothetical protein